MSWIATSLLAAVAALAPQQPQPNGWLGVYLQPDPDRPATIATVVPTSPADRAGLRPDDVIVSVDGRRLRTAESVASSIRGRAVGEVVELGIERDGKSLKVRVELAADPEADERTSSAKIEIPGRGGAPAGESSAAQGDGPAAEGDAPKAGAEEPQDPAGSRSASREPPRLGLELEQRAGGLVVVSVDEGGPAARAGVPVGGVLQTMAGLRVGTLDEVAEVLTALRGDTVRLVVLAGAEQKTIDVRVRGGAGDAAPESGTAGGNEAGGNEAGGNEAGGNEAAGRETPGNQTAGGGSEGAGAGPDAAGAKRFELRRPTLVVFGTSWDEKSKLQRKVLDDPAVLFASKRCDADILWADVALWSDELERLALETVPSAALLRADGSPVEVVKGYQTAEAVVKHLDRLHMVNTEPPPGDAEPILEELDDPAKLLDAYQRLQRRVEGLEALVAELRRKLLELERSSGR